jgi:hypothetical protein
MRHRHAEAIIAWAEGNPIQYKHNLSEVWRDCCGDPIWDADTQYRIKPEKKPDEIKYYGHAWTCETAKFFGRDDKNKAPSDVLRLTFDSETGKLKSAEVL